MKKRVLGYSLMKGTLLVLVRMMDHGFNKAGGSMIGRTVVGINRGAAAF